MKTIKCKVKYNTRLKIIPVLKNYTFRFNTVLKTSSFSGVGPQICRTALQRADSA